MSCMCQKVLQSWHAYQRNVRLRLRLCFVSGTDVGMQLRCAMTPTSYLVGVLCTSLSLALCPQI